ncbi:thermonuclease family protein [Brucella sp. BE17]|uniref:thermonuclease family protein n=1 Tax=Brucella sp. BE17 TaxID=3142977 RepID=UPI0031BA2278
MDRTHFVGKPVRTQLQNKSHSRFVYGGFAAITGAFLLGAFIAPFYGALDGPVRVVASPDGEAAASGSGNGIVVEQFDYDEPDATLHNEPQAARTDGDELQREAPRPPLSDLGLATAPKPREPQAPAMPVSQDEGMQLLQRPVAIAAGRLESQGRIIDLEGIEVLPVEENCRASDGNNWPCGMQARTAFRQWLRSRAVMCRLPQSDSGAAVATRCMIGNEDAAAWLVTNGWARAVGGGAYEESGRSAEQAQRGVYGRKPAANFPDFSSESGAFPDSAPSLSPELLPLPQQGEFPPAPPPPPDPAD